MSNVEKRDYSISVITPFYKGNGYLKQLFGVIRANWLRVREKYPEASIELVLVNDSPEVDVIVPDVEFDFKLTIIRHEINSGIHQARVTGLNSCVGDYIVFLDQDDVLLDHAIVSLLDSMAESASDVVLCNAYMERESGEPYQLYRTRTDFARLNDLEFYLKSHNVIKSPGQALIRKSIIPAEWGKHIMHRNGSDDLFLWILLMEKGCRFTVLREPLYIHKYTGENLSNSESRMGNSSLEIVAFLKEIDYVPEKHARELKKAREFSLCFNQASPAGKLLCAAKNPGLVWYLARNKVKKMLF